MILLKRIEKTTFSSNRTNSKIAQDYFLVDKKASSEAAAEVFETAANLRAEGARVMIAKRNKNAKRQKELLEQEGYTDIRDIF